MFFNKKQKDLDIELSAKEFLELNNRLDDMIREWITVESIGGLQKNSKLAELFIFNMKLIYSSDVYNKELRDFMNSKVDGSGDTDLLFSRIQDLYVNICLCFPSYFIQSIREKHFDILKDLGYDPDQDIYDQTPYAWLMVRIQDIMRFRNVTSK
jgi:hypothetical protein